MYFHSKCFQSSDGSVESQCRISSCLLAGRLRQLFCFMHFSGASNAHLRIFHSLISSLFLSCASHLSFFCLLVSQADDDSSQTPPDYTVRPNIKIHNIGE